MAKTRISEYDSTAANNTDIDNINISEGCPPSGINNAIREVMAHLKDWQSGVSGDKLSIASGGTNAGTVADARTNLGLGALSVKSTVATADIDADAITSAKIADNSIDSEHYVDGSIDDVHLASNSVTTVKIADNSVTSAKIVNGTITGSDIATDTITATNIAANAVSASELNVSGNGTSGQALLSDGDGSFSWGSGFPSGGIIMWSGTIATIPSGWYLCNGSNGTPDLRNRFIIGAHSDDAGAAKTTVTGSATQSGGSKDAIVVSHTHTGSTSSVGDHQHEVFGFWHWVDESIEIMATRLKSTDQSASGRDDDQTSGLAGGHSHTMSLDSAGSSGTNANLPPYYALAFIMKS